MRRVVGLVLMMLALQSCNVLPQGTLSVQAALQESVDSMSSMQVLTAPQRLITQPFHDGVITLATYDAMQVDQRVKVTAVYCVGKRHIRPIADPWFVTGATLERQPSNQPLPPIQFLNSAIIDDACRAYAFGLVTDPAIRQVAATFEDGARVVVPVENGGYLAVSAGIKMVTEIEALDGQGAVIRSFRPINPQQ